MTNPSPEAILKTILPFSRYAQRLLDSEPSQRAGLLKNLQHPFIRAEMLAFLNDHTEQLLDETTLHRVLRMLRKCVLLRLIARDLGGLANLAEVMTCMTDLAEVTICFALKHHQRWLTQADRFGVPQGIQTDTAQQMLVVAMGKLGGRELNVSSDVDLIFVYPEDGETDGNKTLSNHDFFARLGRKLIASLNDFTADSYVFRVDMRLRPYGENSPLAMSFAMLAEYFEKQGREWERYAWIKGRVITGSHEATTKLMEQIVRPFVFRKYLDFGVYESMRRLHAKLRKEVERREMHENIKLGPGGIREIEFITQVFQLIRGGHDVDLCIHPTIAVLERLQKKQQLPPQAVTELLDAYCFLRKLEHRLQYLDDQQTQTLPDNPIDQALIASAMGYLNYAHFLQQLDVHRMQVTHHFELIFAAPRKSPSQEMLAYLWQPETEDSAKTEAATTQLSTMGFTEPAKISERVQQFYNGACYQQLPQSSQQQINALTPMLIEVAAQFPPVEPTLERMLQLLEKISQHTPEEVEPHRETKQHTPYLTLLLEHPHTLQRVAKLVSTSQWASDYLGRHPILLDQLLQHEAPRNKPDWHTLKQELIDQLTHINNPKSDVIEWQMDVLRHFQHAQAFQLLFSDLESSLFLETLSDHLTELADLILAVVLDLAWLGLKKKHQDTPTFAIIGYGKLGGKELGYVSDLDIIFLYDDTHPDAAEIYTKLGQSINGWLTPHTSAGALYKTDLRLRPNGADGLPVHSMTAFTKYQYEQAWVWEHQALTRARFVVGNQNVAETFERTRKEILCQPRDLKELKHDILQMRKRMLKAHPNTTPLFDIKHDRGGIIDVEFIVQFLVLGYACQHAQLTGNIGNIALLKLAGELGLIDVNTAKEVRAAYREFRRTQHRLRLSGDADLADTPATEDQAQQYARVEAHTLNDARNAVLQLWQAVFGYASL